MDQNQQLQLQTDQNYTKSSNGQRRKIDISLNSNNNNSNNEKISKEEKRKIQIKSLQNKYFNKICNAIIKANEQNKKSINFYYNYYDFVNDRLGKPHGFLNEFMYEMCYSNSEFILKDSNNNPITFKTLFGHFFNWELKGKNMMIISW